MIGVGMTKFEKPGSRDWDYPDMAREACAVALADAGIEYFQVQQAYVDYVYGESTSGQRGGGRPAGAWSAQGGRRSGSPHRGPPPPVVHRSRLADRPRPWPHHVRLGR